MRLTTRTNIAMRALMFCAVNEARQVRKSDIAQACNTSENHMAQVINSLAHLGYLTTVRGRAGGVQLACPPEEVSVGRVFRQLESGVPFAECMAGDANTCPLKACCALRDVLCKALGQFYAELDKTSLADLVRGNAPLKKMLELA